MDNLAQVLGYFVRSFVEDLAPGDTEECFIYSVGVHSSFIFRSNLEPTVDNRAMFWRTR